jgi:hypothetical protein
MRRLVLTACAFLAVYGCSSGTQSAAPGATPPRASTDFISQAEISQHSYSNALEIVQGLRPSMLRIRTSTITQSSGTPGMTSNGAVSLSAAVRLDDVLLGEQNQLASIPANTVKEIRYINARDATTLWGTGYPAGVIHVITKR